MACGLDTAALLAVLGRDFIASPLSGLRVVADAGLEAASTGFRATTARPGRPAVSCFAAPFSLCASALTDCSGFFLSALCARVRVPAARDGFGFTTDIVVLGCFTELLEFVELRGVVVALRPADVRGVPVEPAEFLGVLDFAFVSSAASTADAATGGAVGCETTPGLVTRSGTRPFPPRAPRTGLTVGPVVEGVRDELATAPMTARPSVVFAEPARVPE